jgi:hypothetical protein
MKRIAFIQSESWNKDRQTPYSEDHCCYCSKKVKPNAIFLYLSRTDDGEWWLCDPSEPVQADEGTFGRFTLPVGPDCLKRHPEWRFAIVVRKDEA